MTLEGLFELIVMFFGLINSLAIFQMIINKVFWNLINTGVTINISRMQPGVGQRVMTI